MMYIVSHPGPCLCPQVGFGQRKVLLVDYRVRGEENSELFFPSSLSPAMFWQWLYFSSEDHSLGWAVPISLALGTSTLSAAAITGCLTAPYLFS